MEETNCMGDEKLEREERERGGMWGGGVCVLKTGNLTLSLGKGH